MHDTHASVTDCHGYDMSSYELSSILYADDILIICIGKQLFRDCIRYVGLKFGLELNEAKYKVLICNLDLIIRDSQGKPIKTKQSVKYFRNLLPID